MKAPPGHDIGEGHNCLSLNKCIYGIVQAPRRQYYLLCHTVYGRAAGLPNVFKLRSVFVLVHPRSKETMADRGGHECPGHRVKTSIYKYILYILHYI